MPRVELSPSPRAHRRKLPHSTTSTPTSVACRVPPLPPSPQLALVLTLLGGVTRVNSTGQKVRGESHLLMIGDPGTGKSQVSELSSLLPGSRSAGSRYELSAAVVRTIGPLLAQRHSHESTRLGSHLGRRCSSLPPRSPHALS